MNVKLARIKQRLTQEELCKRVGICRSQLSRIENGNDHKVTKEVMLKLSQELHTDIQCLFFSKE